MSEIAKDEPGSGSNRRPWTGNLIQNAVALMVSSGGVAAFGVVFWATAAHLATTQEVGRASAEIAAMMLLANLAQLSFTTIFDRFLPVTGNLTRVFVMSPATVMGPPFRHEHGTTSSPTVPVDRDAAGPARRCQPVGLVRVRCASLTSVLDPARGFCRLRYDSPSTTSS